MGRIYPFNHIGGYSLGCKWWALCICKALHLAACLAAQNVIQEECGCWLRRSRLADYSEDFCDIHFNC